MGFWLFMLVSDLLIPVILLGFGRMFEKEDMGPINSGFGYRTRRSMQNTDTWNFAHRYCGRLWVKLGLWTLLFTIAGMLLVLGKDTQTVGLAGGILCGLQLIPLLGSIAVVERALKRTFDEHGHRRSGQNNNQR